MGELSASLWVRLLVDWLHLRHWLQGDWLSLRICNCGLLLITKSRRRHVDRLCLRHGCFGDGSSLCDRFRHEAHLHLRPDTDVVLHVRADPRLNCLYLCRYRVPVPVPVVRA